VLSETSSFFISSKGSTNQHSCIRSLGLLFLLHTFSESKSPHSHLVVADEKHGILLGSSRYPDAIDDLSTCILRRWAQGLHSKLFKLAPWMDGLHSSMSPCVNNPDSRSVRHSTSTLTTTSPLSESPLVNPESTPLDLGLGPSYVPITGTKPSVSSVWSS